MDDYIEKQKIAAQLFSNPLEILRMIRDLVLFLSLEEKEKAKILLRETINVLMERLKEIVFTGGEEG